VEDIVEDMADTWVAEEEEAEGEKDIKDQVLVAVVE
jgi:hypothetical protein